MKTRWLAVLLLLIAAPLLQAQVSQPSVQGNIAASSSSCATAFSCVWESVLPNNAATTTINISGSFSATLLVEESNNGGQTWTTVATLSAAGTTTYPTNGFTDIRVRCSAFTSGLAAVTISTGLQTGLQGPPGPAGSGGASSPAATQAFAFNVANFSAKNDAITWTNCTTTSGQPTISCPSAAFAAGDIGKITGSTCFPVGSSITIAAFTSATQVSLSTNANANCTGTGVLTYGTNNFTPFQNAMAAALANLGGNATGVVPASVQIPCGRYIWENTSATAATFNVNASGTPAAQFTLSGCGMGNTELIPGNGTVFNTAPGGTLLGFTGNNSACARDLTVNANGTVFTGGIATYILSLGATNIAQGPCTSWSVEVTGFKFTSATQASYGVNCSGCIVRSSNMHDNGTATTNCMMGFLFGGDVVTQGLFAQNNCEGYNLSGVSSARFEQDSIDGCFGGGALTACLDINGNSNNVRFFQSDFVVSGTGLSGVNVNVTAGNKVNFIGNRWICGTGNGAGIRHVGGEVHMRDSPNFCAANTGAAGVVVNSANANFYDDGGNTFVTSPVPLDVISGRYVGTAASNAIYGTGTGVCTASQTLGLYGTGANVTATTCTSTIVGAGQVMNHSGNLMALYVTATAGGVNASSGLFTVTKNGSNTTITCTVGTGTSCKDEAHIVSFVNGDLISVKFTTQAAETLAGINAQIAVN